MPKNGVFEKVHLHGKHQSQSIDGQSATKQTTFEHQFLESQFCI